MVFVFQPDTIQNYSKRFKDIQVDLSGVTSNRSGNGSKKETLPQGVLLSLSFQAVNTGNTKKGECYVYLTLSKRSGQTKAVLMAGYIIGSADPSWVGEMPIEDGDYLVYTVYNSSSTLTGVNLRGFMISV